MPSWLLSLILTVLLTLTNVYSVKSYGEFEYWFSIIKVATIVLFLLLGLSVIFGIVPGVQSPGLSNLIGHGGFMPNGFGSVLLGITVVIFSFMGTEIVAVAAGESSEPARAVRTATNSVIWRILIFYVGSIAVVATLLPWNSANLLKSPFVAVLEHVGIPAVPNYEFHCANRCTFLSKFGIIYQFKDVVRDGENGRCSENFSEVK